MKTIHFKIVTPERVVFEDTVESVSLPTIEGEITILPDHVPAVCLLQAGVITIKKNNDIIPLAVSSGVIEVDGKNIIVLADSADRADELQEEKIEKARADAEKLMAEKRGDEKSYAEATAVLERELARLKVVRRHRRSHNPNPTHEG